MYKRLSRFIIKNCVLACFQVYLPPSPYFKRQQIYFCLRIIAGGAEWRGGSAALRLMVFAITIVSVPPTRDELYRAARLDHCFNTNTIVLEGVQRYTNL